MSNFKLSTRSKNNLNGVKEPLIQVVELAITITTVDFGVIEGLRTIQRQRELVAKGASQTMKSKHLTGHAVDLAAFVGSRLSWEEPLYYPIANAMRMAADELNTPIRWGAAWNVPDIRFWDGSMEDAVQYYIKERRAQRAKPFLDFPHFELMV